VIGMRYGVPTMRREGSTPSTSTTRNFIPGRATNATQDVITTAEAAMTCKPIIGVLAVDLKGIHNDLPQLPDRVPEVR
jgi:hypothetical protein